MASVEVHQAVEGAKGLVPDAVLTTCLQHPEVLHPVPIAAEGERSSEAGGGGGEGGGRAVSDLIPLLLPLLRSLRQVLATFL